MSAARAICCKADDSRASLYSAVAVRARLPEKRSMKPGNRLRRQLPLACPSMYLPLSTPPARGE